MSSKGWLGNFLIRGPKSLSSVELSVHMRRFVSTLEDSFIMTKASLLACGTLLLGAASLAGCSSDDDDAKNSGGTGATGASGGMGGSSGMACVGDPPVTDHNSCTDIPSLKKGAAGFTISSSEFENCAELPSKNTCDGNAFGSGVSPRLTWSGAPEGTLSFALVFKDISL